MALEPLIRCLISTLSVMLAQLPRLKLDTAIGVIGHHRKHWCFYVLLQERQGQNHLTTTHRRVPIRSVYMNQPIRARLRFFLRHPARDKEFELS